MKDIRISLASKEDATQIAILTGELLTDERELVKLISRIQANTK